MLRIFAVLWLYFFKLTPFIISHGDAGSIGQLFNFSMISLAAFWNSGNVSIFFLMSSSIVFFSSFLAFCHFVIRCVISGCNFRLLSR